MRRVRLVLAVALLWAGLRFVIGGIFMPPGLDRPVTLAAARLPVLAGLALAGLVWLAAYLGGRLVAGRAKLALSDAEQGLLVVALGLAVWPIGGGTMGDWLLLRARQGVVGPPTAAPYWPLILEYLFLAIVMAGAAAVSRMAGAPGQPGNTGETPVPRMPRARLRAALGVDPAERGAGVMALLATTLFAGLLMLLLTGPVIGATLRGQVYFAVAASMALAVFAAHRLFGARHSIWYWPAPLLVGLLGAVIAALKPGLLLPLEYNQLNSIPAWGLVRPLPMEMVGVGITACLWTVRAVTAGETHAPA